MIPGTETSEGKGRGGGRRQVVQVYRIVVVVVPSCATTSGSTVVRTAAISYILQTANDHSNIIRMHDELEYLLCIVSPGGAISWRPGNAAESELTFHSLYPWGYRVILSLLVCDDGKPDVEDEPSKRAHDGVEEMDGY